MPNRDDKVDAINYAMKYLMYDRDHHIHATYVERGGKSFATSFASPLVTSTLVSSAGVSSEMESFYKSIMAKKPRPPSKKWTREYVGFESLNDTVEDLTDEAFASVIPNGEFRGKVKITVEYIPDLDDEREHGLEF